jgi:toxin FitB
MMYLLDTGVVAELRKAKSGKVDPGLVAWATGVARHSLFLSSVTLLELHMAATDAGRKDKAAGLALTHWITDQVAPAFEGRILPVDAAVVRRCALLSYADHRDGLLAATALEHGLTLATRNVAAYKVGKPKLFNPWGYAPDEGEDWRQAARAGPLWFKNLFVRA